MTPRNQMYIVAVSIAVLFGVCTLIMTNISPNAFTSSPLSAASATTTNQTGNQTSANMTTTAADGGGDQAAAKMHLDEAMKALQAGDNAGATRHTQAAQDNL